MGVLELIAGWIFESKRDRQVRVLDWLKEHEPETYVRYLANQGIDAERWRLLPIFLLVLTLIGLGLYFASDASFFAAIVLIVTAVVLAGFMYPKLGVCNKAYIENVEILKDAGRRIREQAGEH